MTDEWANRHTFPTYTGYAQDNVKALLLTPFWLRALDLSGNIGKADGSRRREQAPSVRCGLAKSKPPHPLHTPPPQHPPPPSPIPFRFATGIFDLGEAQGKKLQCVGRNETAQAFTITTQVSRAHSDRTIYNRRSGKLSTIPPY